MDSEFGFRQGFSWGSKGFLRAERVRQARCRRSPQSRHDLFCFFLNSGCHPTPAFGTLTHLGPITVLGKKPSLQAPSRPPFLHQILKSSHRRQATRPSWNFLESALIAAGFLTRAFALVSATGFLGCCTEQRKPPAKATLSVLYF